MWGAISKLFKANDNITQQRGNNGGASLDMDRGDDRRPDMDLQDAQDTRQAKQRASVKWLLSKAFNNKVPENLREPFYRDHENQEHLKPQIVGSLANAEMYCLALGNIYSDPNYHNLNHWSILQTLARKGVFVTEPSDAQLTETTLIQTNPLRMSAHMAVIESMMVLYAKEVVSADRVLAAVLRFGHGRNTSLAPPENHEQGLLLWIAHACGALKRRIDQELESGQHNGGEGDRLHSPKIPVIKELKDLCDGVALAALVSYYCQDELPWQDLVVSYLPTVSESLHNLSLLHSFCQRCLPCSVFHMLPEDITYMRGSMKQNLIVFLADLFNMLEIHPAKCVRYPGMDKSLNVIRSPSAHLTIRKSQSLQQSTSELSEDSLRRGSDDSFVVHRGKGIPTLSSVIQAEEPLVPARLRPAKEKQNNDSKAEEYGSDGKKTAAGKPSNWEDQRRSSYAGRRSRRNSISDDSQLTIENFGGSQDNLNFIGRNPDKDVAVHVGRKISAPTGPFENNVAIRSTKQDAIGSIQLGYDNGYEKQDDGREKLKLKRQLSSDAISLKNIIHSKEDLMNDVVDGDVGNRMSFADLSKQQKYLGEQNAIQLVYMQHEKDEGIPPSKSSFLNKSGNTNGNGEKKTTTFAALPNTTTWQQQSSNNQQLMSNNSNEDSNSGNHPMASQLNDIRMKLEEKRRHIENEKRRMEVVMNKQRQKVGKAAFLQAVTKEITDDAMSVEHKWLEQDGGAPFIETRRTPEIENMDMEQYQQSITHLQDIQADIHRLASQQSQIQAQQQQALLAQQHTQHMQALAAQHMQAIPHYAPPQNIYNPLQSYGSAPHLPQYPGHLATSPRLQMEQPQFYLHDQSPPQPPQRRTWAQHATPPVHPSEHYPQQQMTPPQPELRTWSKPQNTSFILHDTPERYQEKSRYQNGEHSLSNNHSGYTLSQQHAQASPSLFPASSSSTSSSPQHRNNSVHRQISQLMGAGDSPVNLQQLGGEPYVEKQRSTSVTHAPIPAPSMDDMEPQNISFIGSSDDTISEGISRLNITSGSRTYRIPSPTRTVISRNAFQQRTLPEAPSAVDKNEKESASEKGFYISFDNEQPKRPKPPLRAKKMSPKKERGTSFIDTGDDINFNQGDVSREEQYRDRQERTRMLERELERERLKQEEREMEKHRKEQIQAEWDRPRERKEASQEWEAAAAAAAALIIGNDLSNPDPDLVDERERKKEKIMLLSLQRRQQQEESKERKEAEAQARREYEKAKEDERARKKEEQAQRRAAILEQYKLKKAIEEAEREGKVLDKSELMSSLKPTPKMRPKGSTSRPRPKTIHIDSGSVEMAEGMMQPSRGKKGSTSNLTANSFAPQSSMKRDYYRGSQDSLADRGMSSGLLYQDSPDDSRGLSPCRSANQTLGRRGSYKTSRDPSPSQVRGRPKYPTYQNFKGRKSNSMMNLYGSSSDQDSMVYRYGDTDSGLGRATPPRRAPSPGMGPMRHLPSPSGPGSLPGLMSKRRVFDDGSSDISSTPSSMMDYTGPRLYKQPATKSNRGIMLNAVEYCVFPGVVNKEAKRRVLEEIARSESKHFLILFRDAGFQFRALYSYCPDREDVTKLYGTGPKQVNDRMFDKFFKYNSGGKCFSQVHTKHLTVTIDAFTIHNSLWQGKKVNLPNKKDMALVI